VRSLPAHPVWVRCASGLRIRSVMRSRVAGSRRVFPRGALPSRALRQRHVSAIHAFRGESPLPTQQETRYGCTLHGPTAWHTPGLTPAPRAVLRLRAALADDGPKPTHEALLTCRRRIRAPERLGSRRSDTSNLQADDNRWGHTMRKQRAAAPARAGVPRCAVIFRGGSASGCAGGVRRGRMEK
jgi:hypothetical protein